jgi:hypothetical protein
MDPWSRNAWSFEYPRGERVPVPGANHEPDVIGRITEVRRVLLSKICPRGAVA